MIRVPGQSDLIPGAVRHGDLIITSGVVCPRAVAGEPGSVPEQVDAALCELANVLERAGSGLARVLKLDAFLTDPSDFATWNAAFLAAWPDPDARPARTTLVVGFAMAGIAVELQATAIAN